MYQCSIPYRHKFDYPAMKKIIDKNKLNNINIPLFSVYYDKNDEEHRYNYIECRYFYCHYYELLVSKTNDFLDLKQMIANGYNLQIIGYDGFMIDNSKDLMDYYLDKSRPFGHELVLYTMLVIDNKKDYPWNKYYVQHKDIYEGVI